MAHFILEYSGNLSPAELRIDELFIDLHRIAVDSGVFPLAGIRSRAIACVDFRVADGAPGNAFAHLTVKVGSGRETDALLQVASLLNEALEAHFEPLFDERGMALSMEMQELHPLLRFNRNNLRDRMDAAGEIRP